MAQPVSYFDPKLITQLGPLRLRAAYVADGLVAGGYISKRYGSSTEFADHKQYSPGDETRHIDWKLHARTDRYFVRRFEDESNRNFLFLMDCSGSMSYRSKESSWSKWECAATIASCLATICIANGDAVGWLLRSEHVDELYMPSRLQHSLVKLNDSLASITPAGRCRLSEAMLSLAESLPKRTCVIVISDLLDPIDAMELSLNRLIFEGHQTILLQVLDHEEIEFTTREGGNFVDLEDGSQLNVDPLLVRERYLESLNAHNAALSNLIVRLNDYHGRCSLHQLDSSQPIAPGLVAAFERTASGT